MKDKYILNKEGNPEKIEDILEWGKYMESNNRHIAKDFINSDIMVSTVFLGLDHSFGGPIPILYETMIFGGKHDQYQKRYATKEEALEGHKKALALALADKTVAVVIDGLNT